MSQLPETHPVPIKAPRLPDHLQSQAETPPGAASWLHIQASEWSETQGSLELAIRHALYGQAWPRAAYLIDHLADDLLGGDRAGDLQGWLVALPGDTLETWPRLRIIQAHLCLRNDELEQAGRLLEEIRSLFSNPRRLASLHLPSFAPIGDGPQEVRGHLEEVRAELALETGRVELALELARQALQALPLSRPLWRGLAAGCMAQASMRSGEIEQAGQFFAQAGWEAERAGSQSLSFTCGLGSSECLWKLGRLQAALATCQDLLRGMLAQGSAGGPLAGRLYARWAELLVEGGQLDEALAAADQAQSLAGGVQPAVFEARLALVRVHLARREVQAARRLLSGVARRAGNFARPGKPDLPGKLGLSGKTERLARLALEADFLRIGIELASGEIEAAQQLLNILDPERIDRLDREERLAVRLQARLLLVQGQPRAALARLEAQFPDDSRTGRVPAELDRLILLALAHQAAESEQAALDMLAQALFLAAPESWLQPFLNYGRAMTRLLYRAAAQDIQPDFINQLLAKCPPE